MSSRAVSYTHLDVYKRQDVVFTQAPKHYELLISNKHRAVKDNELEVIREFFLKRKIDKDIVLMDKLRTVHTDKLIEISFPTTV